MANELRLILDADTVLYRVGFSSPPSEAAAISQLNTYIDTIYDRAFSRYRGMVTGVCTATLRYSMVTVPSGKRYRDKFNKETEYKEHRSSAPVPAFLQEMRRYLVDTGYAIPVDSSSMEADDLVSIKSRQFTGLGYPVVVIGVDKDLLQIPGWHYNYVKDELFLVQEKDAEMFFFKQLLMGDVADNIPGIRGIGPKKADKLLQEGNNPQEWWDIVLDTYTNTYKKLSNEELCEILYERGNKLWIQRKHDQEWYPPVPD